MLLPQVLVELVLAYGEGRGVGRILHSLWPDLLGELDCGDAPGPEDFAQLGEWAARHGFSTDVGWALREGCGARIAKAAMSEAARAGHVGVMQRCARDPAAHEWQTEDWVAWTGEAAFHGHGEVVSWAIDQRPGNKRQLLVAASCNFLMGGFGDHRLVDWSDFDWRMALAAGNAGGCDKVARHADELGACYVLFGAVVGGHRTLTARLVKDGHDLYPGSSLVDWFCKAMDCVVTGNCPIAMLAPGWRHADRPSTLTWLAELIRGKWRVSDAWLDAWLESAVKQRDEALLRAVWSLGVSPVKVDQLIVDLGKRGDARMVEVLWRECGASPAAVEVALACLETRGKPIDVGVPTNKRKREPKPIRRSKRRLESQHAQLWASRASENFNAT